MAAAGPVTRSTRSTPVAPLGRTSSWPYGSASAPVTTRTSPRAGRAASSGSRTTIPPVPSWIAMSGGVPSRPGSAVTVPRTVTVAPIGLAAGLRDRVDRRGRGRGRGRGDRRSRGSRSPVGFAEGVGDGATDGDGVGATVGEGVGGGVTIEVAGAGDVQAIARRAAAGAVALAERPRRGDPRTGRQVDAGERARRDDQADRSAPVVDRHRRPVGELVTPGQERARGSDPQTLGCLVARDRWRGRAPPADPACRARRSRLARQPGSSAARSGTTPRPSPGPGCRRGSCPSPGVVR